MCGGDGGSGSSMAGKGRWMECRATSHPTPAATTHINTHHRSQQQVTPRFLTSSSSTCTRSALPPLPPTAPAPPPPPAPAAPAGDGGSPTGSCRTRRESFPRLALPMARSAWGWVRPARWDGLCAVVWCASSVMDVGKIAWYSTTMFDGWIPSESKPFFENEPIDRSINSSTSQTTC